jgi:hypothetical protein
MGHLDQIRSIKISDKQNLMGIHSEAGTYSEKFENGVVLTITIEKGKMVKHEAKDRAGNSLKTSILRISGIGEETCYVCFHVDTPQMFCGKIPCKWV